MIEDIDYFNLVMIGNFYRKILDNIYIYNSFSVVVNDKNINKVNKMLAEVDIDNKIRI